MGLVNEMCLFKAFKAGLLESFWNDSEKFYYLILSPIRRFPSSPALITSTGELEMIMFKILQLAAKCNILKMNN